MLVSMPCFWSSSHARMPSHVEAIYRASERQAVQALPSGISFFPHRASLSPGKAEHQVSELNLRHPAPVRARQLHSSIQGHLGWQPYIRGDTHRLQSVNRNTPGAVGSTLMYILLGSMPFFE